MAQGHKRACEHDSFGFVFHRVKYLYFKRQSAELRSVTQYAMPPQFGSMGNGSVYYTRRAGPPPTPLFAGYIEKLKKIKVIIINANAKCISLTLYSASKTLRFSSEFKTLLIKW